MYFLVHVASIILYRYRRIASKLWSLAKIEPTSSPRLDPLGSKLRSLRRASPQTAFCDFMSRHGAGTGAQYDSGDGKGLVHYLQYKDLPLQMVRISMMN